MEVQALDCRSVAGPVGRLSAFLLTLRGASGLVRSSMSARTKESWTFGRSVDQVGFGQPLVSIPMPKAIFSRAFTSGSMSLRIWPVSWSALSVSHFQVVESAGN
jgi:hypothetical protein